MSGERVDLSFRTALRRVDDAGRLLKVNRPFSTDDEVAGLMRKLDGDRALLFDHVEPVPVLGNLLSSERNVEAAFGTSRDGVRALLARGLSNPIPEVVVDAAPVHDVVHTSDIDLGAQLPVLRHAPGDGDRFVTGGVVIARHPETGIANASFHRMQLLGGARTAIKLDLGRHLRTLWDEARRLDVDLPIAVAIGADISLLYAAAFMGSRMPLEADEIAAAGGVRGAGLELVQAVSQDMLVPADAEIVLEGAISASETVHEGPFGEFLGYHSDEGPSPVVTVTALTHRPDPVYVAISGVGRETVMLRKHVLETAALSVARAVHPMVADVNLTAGGLHRFHAVVAVEKTSEQDDGFPRNVALALFGALKDLDLVVLVDDDIDLHDETDVEYAMATRFEASRDLVVIPAARSHEYIRVSDEGVRSKLVIDATVPFSERERFRRVAFVDVEVADGDLSPERSSPALPWL